MGWRFEFNSLGRSILARSRQVTRRFPRLSFGRQLHSHLLVGLIGEQLAARRLKRAGCRIAARRFRTSSGEIDLIAWDADVLCFVEVKTRRGWSNDPAEAWTPEKQERVLRTCRMFLQGHHLGHVRWRIDVVTVRILSWRRWKIEWFRNAGKNITGQWFTKHGPQGDDDAKMC